MELEEKMLRAIYLCLQLPLQRGHRESTQKVIGQWFSLLVLLRNV